MKLYLAGMLQSGFHRTGPLYARLPQAEQRARDCVEHHLESYHYLNARVIERIRADGVRVLLDSGAFSAYTKGVEIDLKQYCSFIEQYQDIVHVEDGALCASVLDGIGDPLKTWQNQRTMEQLGVRPLPCFHYAEDERYLEWYISKYDYITIGGMVPISTPQLKIWLDRIWEKYLTDSSGRPRLKVHGFGLTSVELMIRYPWYSVDSSTWVQAAAFGDVFLVEMGARIGVTQAHSGRKTDGAHLETLNDIMREKVSELITSKGFELDRLSEDYSARWAFNAWAFSEVGRLLDQRDTALPVKQKGLF